MEAGPFFPAFRQGSVPALRPCARAILLGQTAPTDLRRRRTGVRQRKTHVPDRGRVGGPDRQHLETAQAAAARQHRQPGGSVPGVELVVQPPPLDQPHGHWSIELVSVLVLVVAPAWTGCLAVRLARRWLWARRRLPARTTGAAGAPASYLERYAVGATLRFASGSTRHGARRAPERAGRGAADLARRMRQAEGLERVRAEIADLKGRLKGLYGGTAITTAP